MDLRAMNMLGRAQQTSFECRAVAAVEASAMQPLEVLLTGLAGRSRTPLNSYEVSLPFISIPP